MSEPIEPHHSAKAACARGFSLRRVLITLAWIASLIALFYAVENWRGQRAWENCQKEMAAKGEPLKLAAYIPPPVPDDQNFAMTPFLAPLFNYGPHGSPATNLWRDPAAFERAIHFGDAEVAKVAYDRGNLGEILKSAVSQPDVVSQLEREQAARAVLDALRNCDPIIEELRAASSRPHARFNIHYEEGASALVPHLMVVKKVSTILKHRAIAELALGEFYRAYADVQLGFYIFDVVRREPLHISQLICIAELNILVPALQDAAARHAWSDDQWRGVQTTLAQFDFFAGYRQALHSDMNFATVNLEELREESTATTVNDNMKWLFISLIAPRGWLYQNIVTLNRLFFDTATPTMNSQTRRVFPKLAAEIETRWEKGLPAASPYNVLANFLVKLSTEQWRDRTPLKFATAQVLIDQARLVAALERFRLANQNYPESLDALAPRFIDKVPHDIITGGPMKYRRSADGKFLLYSVGWNETDDDGVTAMTPGSTPSPNRTRGDWVW